MDNRKVIEDLTNLSWDKFDMIMSIMYKLSESLGKEGYLEKFNEIKRVSELGRDCPYAIAAAKLFVRFGYWRECIESINEITRTLDKKVETTLSEKDEEGEKGDKEEQQRVVG